VTGAGGGAGSAAKAAARYTYYGAFAPGLEECIAEVLGERSPDLTIPLLLSGAVVFETALSYDRLNFFCFNNVFEVISFTTERQKAGERPSREALENFVRHSVRRGALAAGFRGGVKAGPAGSAGSFRVIFSLENTPAALSEDLRREAEARIASLSGLKVNRSRPDTEFWFLLRREGAFFLRRLSRRRPWDKLLHPGELPPPLAWTLCRLSGPKPGERVADPFCGYGAIPAARLRHFPPAEFFASDIDRRALKTAQAKFKGGPGHRCHFNCLDAGELPRLIPPASLDSIITDPPWGFYQGPAEKGRGPSPGGGRQEQPQARPQAPSQKRPCGLGELYRRSLAVFAGLLKPGAPAVILCGRGEELRAAAEHSGFTITRQIPILLSGRKTAIYVLRSPEQGPAVHTERP
jgi:tRNA G10  N-methylase Trm11